jgi:hypothetical protein
VSTNPGQVQYRKLGGRVPPPLAVALESAKMGRNVETAMNNVCEEMSRFLASIEEFCARYAGFQGVEHMKREGGVRGQDVKQYYVCMAHDYVRAVPSEAVKKVLYIGDPKSFVSVFSSKTLKQAWGLIAKYLKKKVIDGLSRNPTYENPCPSQP